MFDRLCMPVLTFTLLVAALAAFAADFTQGGAPQQRPAAQLERVVIVAQREFPIASANGARMADAQRR